MLKKFLILPLSLVLATSASAFVAAPDDQFTFDNRLVDAVEQNNSDIVKALLLEGDNPNQAGKFETSALHRAVFNNNSELMLLLIQNGANVNIRDYGGATPLHIAARQGEPDAAKTLLQKGADINAKDSEGYTPLHRAITYNKSDISMLLIQSGANINTQNKEGNTPLIDAVRVSNPLLVKELIIKGASKSTKNHKGLDALDYAMKLRNSSVDSILSKSLTELKQADAPVETVNIGGPAKGVPAFLASEATKNKSNEFSGVTLAANNVKVESIDTLEPASLSEAPLSSTFSPAVKSAAKPASLKPASIKAPVEPEAPIFPQSTINASSLTDNNIDSGGLTRAPRLSDKVQLPEPEKFSKKAKITFTEPASQKVEQDEIKQVTTIKQIPVNQFAETSPNVLPLSAKAPEESTYTTTKFVPKKHLTRAERIADEKALNNQPSIDVVKSDADQPDVAPLPVSVTQPVNDIKTQTQPISPLATLPVITPPSNIPAPVEPAAPAPIAAAPDIDAAYESEVDRLMNQATLAPDAPAISKAATPSPALIQAPRIAAPVAAPVVAPVITPVVTAPKFIPTFAPIKAQPASLSGAQFKAAPAAVEVAPATIVNNPHPEIAAVPVAAVADITPPEVEAANAQPIDIAYESEVDKIMNAATADAAPVALTKNTTLPQQQPASMNNNYTFHHNPINYVMQELKPSATPEPAIVAAPVAQVITAPVADDKVSYTVTKESISAKDIIKSASVESNTQPPLDAPKPAGQVINFRNFKSDLVGNINNFYNGKGAATNTYDISESDNRRRENLKLNDPVAEGVADLPVTAQAAKQKISTAQKAKPAKAPKEVKEKDIIAAPVAPVATTENLFDNSPAVSVEAVKPAPVEIKSPEVKAPAQEAKPAAKTSESEEMKTLKAPETAQQSVTTVEVVAARPLNITSAKDDNGLIGSHSLIENFSSADEATKFYNENSSKTGLVYNYKVLKTNSGKYALAIGKLNNDADAAELCSSFNSAAHPCSPLPVDITQYTVTGVKKVFAQISDFKSNDEAKKYYQQQSQKFSNPTDYTVVKSAAGKSTLQIGPVSSGGDAKEICDNFTETDKVCKVAVK